MGMEYHSREEFMQGGVQRGAKFSLFSPIDAPFSRYWTFTANSKQKKKKQFKLFIEGGSTVAHFAYRASWALCKINARKYSFIDSPGLVHQICVYKSVKNTNAQNVVRVLQDIFRWIFFMDTWMDNYR